MGALIGASFELGDGYHLLAESLGQVLFFEQRGSDAADHTAAKPAVRLTLGIGKHF